MKLRTRRRAGAIGVALAMAGALLAPTPALAADPPLTNPVALERGHIDAFTTALNDDGSVQLMLSDDATGSHVNRTPESVDMVVKSAAQQTFSAIAAVPPELRGQTVYRLPASQNQNLIWPGWDTNSLKPVYGEDVSVDFAIEVAGPGTVWAWYQNDDGEPATHLTSGDFTVSPADTIRQPFPSHTHTNWAFSAAGTYDFTVTAHVNGNGLTATSNTATYTFVVAPTLEITDLQDSYADGAAIELTAASPVEGAAYEWSVGGTVVDGQTGAQLSLTAAQDLDGAAVSVRQIGSVGTEITTAPPVTLNVDEPAAPEQILAITGLSHHYHQGSPIALNAVATPAVEGASYEWFMQRTDQAAPVRIEGQSGAQLGITAEQALDGALVTANMLDADDEVLASADAVTIDVDDHGQPPLQQVTISGAAHHYHTGDTAHLSASVSPASVLTRYEWQVQNAGEDTWSTIADENDDEYLFEVAEALDGAHVRVVLTFDDGTPYVASAPVEIAIDDHHGEEPVETSLSITGLSHHYHTGDIANLTAVQDPATDEDHYHWFIKRAGDDNYSVIAGELTANLAHTIATGDHGAEIIVRLYDHGHNVIAESDPVTIAIDDHHGEEPVETALSITGLKDHYHTGSTATLTAVQDPATDEDHYHWYVKRSSDLDYTVIPGALSETLVYTVLAEDDGAEIIVRLFDHDHSVIAESDPVTLKIDDHHGDGDGDGKPTAAPADRTSGDLDGIPAGGITLDKSEVKQGGTVRVQLGDGNERAGEWVAAWMFSEPVLLGGDWQLVGADGSILVRIPASTTPGTHSIAVYDAEGNLIGWQSIKVTAGDLGNGAGGSGTDGSGAKALSKTGSDAPLLAIGGVALLMLAGGGVLLLAHRRRAVTDD